MYVKICINTKKSYTGPSESSPCGLMIEVWWSHGPWSGERVKTTLDRTWTEDDVTDCGIVPIHWHVRVLPDHPTIGSGEEFNDNMCLHSPEVRRVLPTSVKCKMYRRHKLRFNNLTSTSTSGQTWIWQRSLSMSRPIPTYSSWLLRQVWHQDTNDNLGEPSRWVMYVMYFNKSSYPDVDKSL